MALINCPKCGKEISDKAKKCVGCGWEVDLSMLNAKEDEAVPNETDSNRNISYERKIMLKEAELEIERMKENARQEVNSMHESAKAMAIQKQKELDLEYKKREEELYEKKEFLQKMQDELEQAKKTQQISKSQHVETVKRKVVLPNINILFILIPVAIMLCFMVIVWRRLDSFSTEIEFLVSNNIQAESEMIKSNTENITDEKIDEIIETDTIKSKPSLSEEIMQDEIEGKSTTETTDSDIETTKDVLNDSILQVTFDSYKPLGYSYTEFIFTVKNISNDNIDISIDQYQYLNDVAVYAICEYNSKIPKDKASVVSIKCKKDDISFSDINKIEFCYKVSDNTNAEVESSVVFDNLNVNIE